MAKRKPGKYDHLLHKLKKLPPADLAHQEKIRHRQITLRICPRCNGRKVELIECNYCTSADEDCHACGGTRKLETSAVCQLCNGTGEWQLTAERLANLYVAARVDALEIAIVVSAMNVELEALTQLLIESQENKAPEWGAFGASDRAMKLTNGDSIRVQPEPIGVVKDKNAFRQWCFKNQLEPQMELPEKKTQDLMKARLLVADGDPDGTETYMRARIVYTPMKTEVAEQQTVNDDETIF